MSYDEAWHLIRAPSARLLAGNPNGWDYEALGIFERKLDVNSDGGSWMYGHVVD